MHRLNRLTALVTAASLLALPFSARAQDDPRGAPVAQPQQLQQQPQAPPPVAAPPAPAQQYPYPQQPGYAPYPVPNAYYYPPRRLVYRETRRWGLFWTGVGITGGVWLMNVLFGGVGGGEGAFYVPVAGPAIYAAQYSSRNDGNPYYSSPDDQSKRAVTAFMVLDTLVYLTGVGMIIGGLATRHKVAVEQPAVSVAPLLSPSVAGLSAVGRF